MMDSSRSTPDANSGEATDTSGEGFTDTNNTGNNTTYGNKISDSTSSTQGQTGNGKGKA